MRQINYHLTSNNSTGVVELLDNEKAILLTAERHPNNTPMTYSLFNDAGKLIRNKTLKEPVIRLSRQHFDTLKLEVNPSLQNFVKGSIFIGSWAEITVLDLYKYIDFYFYSANINKLLIIVGLSHIRHLRIEQIDENRIRVGLFNSGYVLAEDFDPNSETGQYIHDLYIRIRERISDDDFKIRQETQSDKLLANVDHLISVY